jgi:dihydrofolate synthase / folylpolyglutamate synthase
MTIVTDISYDHIEILGKTLTKIAREKAGIIKPSVPHLIGFLPPQPVRVMESFCQQRHAPLHKVNMRNVKLYPDQFALDYASKQFSVKKLKPSLIGTHQLSNCILVLRAISLLQEKGIRISKRAVITGITSTSWPGRFQTIAHKGKPTMILDVCHNPSGVKAFVNTYQTKYPNRKSPIIVGIVRKKEHQEMFDYLANIASEYILVPLKTRRSVNTRELMQEINWRNVMVRRSGNLRKAIDFVVKKGTPDDIILVVGSHYLIGEYLNTYGWS